MSHELLKTVSVHYSPQLFSCPGHLFVLFMLRNSGCAHSLPASSSTLLWGCPVGAPVCRATCLWGLFVSSPSLPSFSGLLWFCLTGSWAKSSPWMSTPTTRGIPGSGKAEPPALASHLRRNRPSLSYSWVSIWFMLGDGVKSRGEKESRKSGEKKGTGERGWKK